MKKRKAPKQTGQFVALTADAQARLQGKPGRVWAVYAYLLKKAGPRAQAQLGTDAIRKATGLSLRSTERSIADLKRLGLLEVKRTHRRAFRWMPLHPGYDADHAEYLLKKARNEERKAAAQGAPHMEPPHPHMEPPIDDVRTANSGGSGSATGGGSMSIDVSSSYEEEKPNRCSPPPGARPSGPSAPSGDEAGGADSARPDADQPTRPPTWAVGQNILSHRSDQRPKNGAPAAPHLKKNSPAWHEAWQEKYPDYVPVPAGEQVPDLVLHHGWVWVVHNGHHIPRFDMQGWNAKRRFAAERIS